MAQVSPITKQSARWRVLLNTGIVMAGTLLSRVLGLAREAIFSRRFGLTPEFGAFSATFSILDILYLVIIGGALGSTLIPVFSRLLHEERTERAWELANTVLTLAFTTFIAIALLVGVFARPLLALTVAQSYSPDLLDLSVHLLRIMLVQPLLLGLGGLMMALLQSFERFTLPSVAFNIYNLAIIAAAWLFAPVYGISALAWGVVGGALLYLLVMLPGVVQAGLRFRPSFHWRMPEVIRVGQLLAPRLIGQSALQINLIVMISLFGLFSASAQAANRFAFQLLMLPHGILAISVGTVMFPRLARLFVANDVEALRQTALQTLRLVLWLTVPAAIMLAVLHVPIIRLLFQGGRFDNEALRLTGRLLLFYAPGAIGLAGVEIVIRTFYAMEDTRTPVIVGVATIAANALIASTVVRLTPDVGLVALSYSMTNLLEFVGLLVLLLRRLPRTGNLQLGRSVAALAVGGFALAGTLLGLIAVSRTLVPGVSLGSRYQAGSDFLLLAGWLVLASAIGFGAYLAVGAVVRAPEVGEVRSLIRRRRSAQ